MGKPTGKRAKAERAEKYKDIILYPLITEKAVDSIEKDNKIAFIVGKKATKPEIKNQIEKEFNVKVESVNVLNDMKGRKRAIVKIAKEFKANDIAMKLGVI
ncbi:MAG: 50S ribosomal protein L23 [Candidatus Diapherotrites archaeon]